MGSLPGMEKFSHLEDKIYLTIEFAKQMREEKEKLERETNSLRHEVSSLLEEKVRLEEKIERLMSERDAIQLKIEAMLDAITVIEPEVAEVISRQIIAMIGNRTKADSTQSIRVEIYDQTYNIRSDGDNEYILRLAEYVDGKMREIAKGSLTVDSLKVAILAALHIADELHRTKSQQEQNDQQLASRSAECAEMLDKFLKQREIVAHEVETEQQIEKTHFFKGANGFSRPRIFPFCAFDLVKSISGRGSFSRIRARNTNFEPMLYESGDRCRWQCNLSQKRVAGVSGLLVRKGDTFPTVEKQVQ